MNAPVMDGMMTGGMMMFCMVAGGLLALVFLVLIIIQTILQWKILGQVRQLKKPGG